MLPWQYRVKSLASKKHRASRSVPALARWAKSRQSAMQAYRALGPVQIAQVEKIAKKEVHRNVEDKYIDTSITASTLVAQLNNTTTTVGSGHRVVAVTPLPDLGTDYNQRIGQKLTLRSFNLKGQIVGQGGGESGTLAGNTLRVCLVQFKCPLPASAFNISEYLDYNYSIADQNSITYPASQIWDTHCLRDPNFRKVYKTLKVEDYVLPYESSASNAYIFTDIDFHVDLSKLEPLRVSDQPGIPTAMNYGLYLVFLAATGNYGSALTTPMVGVGQQTGGTGMVLNGWYRTFYEDA